MEKPLVQVAIDALNLERAAELTRTALEAGADWVEAGTPLIVYEGIRSIGSVVEMAEGRPVVADFKAQNKLFDTVICLNVIEHLDDDIQAMQNIAGLIEKNGKAIVLVPRGRWLHGTLDEILDHKRRYSVDALKKLAEEAFRLASHKLSVKTRFVDRSQGL